MKALRLIVMIALFIPTVCNAQPRGTALKAPVSDKIEAYYFHNTSRCVTCRSIEAEAKKNIETLYPDLFKKGKIRFTSLNLEEGTGKAMARKLGIAGQTLMIVRGTKKIDLTSQAFMYARNNPGKLKSIMKEKVDVLLAL